ncbi:MAG: hypothetical protein U9O18_10415, partial [Chloroflexota bacterium]|nr:hypothetical protein [Chloroflexota bacterium]
MADREPRPVPDDPREWAPMRPYDGRRKFDVIDPVIEPLWSGTRVLAHLVSTPDAEGAVDLALIEELGADLVEELPALAEALGRSVMAIDAIIDGVIS